jgi:hypothetical protein
VTGNDGGGGGGGDDDDVTDFISHLLLVLTSG